MRKYIVDSITKLTPDVVQLSLRPQRSSSVLKFFPGQYADIGFKVHGRPTPMRCFSMVSSPNNTQQLQFALRVEGNFTQTAARLQLGDEVSVQGPFGEFVIDERYDRSVVMFAGGIGITPYMSMLRHAAESNLQIPITLLYSCRNQDEIPFFNELIELQRRNPRFRAIFFVTGGVVSEAPGARIVSGRISKAWVDKVTRDTFRGSTYFLCGASGFMENLGGLLATRGVDENHILTESFTQASKTSALGGKFSLQTLTYAFSALLLLVGIGGIMVLDLDRSLPKLVSAAAQQKTTTNQTASSNGGSSSNSSSSSSNSTTTTAPTYQYQAPVTSAS